MVAVAIVGPTGDWVLDGDEATILADTDRILADLTPGVIVTWNGANFDLPFLADRARGHGLSLGLELVHDTNMAGRHKPLPGHSGPYRARWHRHGHLDAYQVYRADVGAILGLPCGLKPLSRYVGLPVVEVDRERIHELSVEEQRAYVASDARLTRALAQRRPTALAAVDQLADSIG
ncbi:MAG: 3'-5' exonuclease [Acidimicrobiales bacterium]|nr:3'-5' exonuclease [Acidimicrobiales bacterium]MDG2217142.1 3'-5' exonuclease [Acidimicrobiales bacterium]